MSLLKELNDRYVALHRAKEEAFWVEKMGLVGSDGAGFEQKEIALKDFSSSPENLGRVRSALEGGELTETERVGLQGWERFFRVNQIEGEEAKACYRGLVEKEGELERRRMGMRLGYTDPETGEFVEASSVGLALKIRSAKEEPLRMAAFEGLRSIEPFVLENGFIEIVKERNRLARMLASCARAYGARS